MLPHEEDDVAERLSKEAIFRVFSMCARRPSSESSACVQGGPIFSMSHHTLRHQAQRTNRDISRQQQDKGLGSVIPPDAQGMMGEAADCQGIAADTVEAACEEEKRAGCTNWRRLSRLLHTMILLKILPKIEHFLLDEHVAELHNT